MYIWPAAAARVAESQYCFLLLSGESEAGREREGGILPSAPQRCHGLEDARELKED